MIDKCYLCPWRWFDLKGQERGQYKSVESATLFGGCFILGLFGLCFCCCFKSKLPIYFSSSGSCEKDIYNKNKAYSANTFDKQLLTVQTEEKKFAEHCIGRWVKETHKRWQVHVTDGDGLLNCFRLNHCVKTQQGPHWQPFWFQWHRESMLDSSWY